MPSSALAVAPYLIHEVWKVRDEARRVVDVGAGFGKYGSLLREYVWGLEGDFERLDAIEVHRPYYTPERYAQYNKTIFADCLSLSREDWQAWDLVFMSDVLEHIRKEEAIELFERIPGYIVVCTPENFFMNWKPGDAASEKHVSHWKVEDFRAADGWSKPKIVLEGIITTRRPKEGH